MKENILIGGNDSFVNIKSIPDILLVLVTSIYIIFWILLTFFPNGWISQLGSMSYSAGMPYSIGYGLGIFLLGFILFIIYMLFKLFIRWIMAWRPVPVWVIIFSKCILIIILCAISFSIYHIYSIDVLEIASSDKKELKFFVRSYDTCKTSILFVLGVFIPSFIAHAHKFYRRKLDN